MHVNRITEIFIFFIGFNLGIYLYFNFLPLHKKFKAVQNHPIKNFPTFEVKYEAKYDTKLADELVKNVRIFCWILTHPKNHKTKIPHMKATWARRCDKLVIFSTETDKDDPDIVALSNLNGREHLWNKTKYAMKYVYENHINDADWFVRADDDNYFIVENLRHKLSQYNPKMSVFIGCRYAVPYNTVDEGYMAGGGHAFSKKALTKFVTKLMPSGKNCIVKDAMFEDVNLGMCFKTHAVFVDALDEKNQKQMFPLGIDAHADKNVNTDFWYWHYIWSHVPQGNLDCCSDLFISAHYVGPKEQHLLEYLVYHVHPFGIVKNQTEKLPEKLKMGEVMKKADEKSISPQYVAHEIVHNFDDDEKDILLNE
ncbi:hypothetical protein PVAND_015420 [Polypedilum vanderplanki]|uniref:N-acetylgalactosaminide beta-1,3-galactosyltransferase n=1 Tax=Polypedilum vanderplanki TaxID=319348 RepID=A0A9J6BCY9_POLVA|nr:hypothetical protein PVAND_015420 [Polypedilum vanderplanki]